jgi:hypothetical protein
MSVAILSLTEDGLIEQNFVELVREKLIAQLGDHKWLVEILNEQVTPEEFNTSYSDYVTKFFCSKDCFCEAAGDCDQDDCNCVFAVEQVGIRVQYNIKTGEVEKSAIKFAVEQARTEFGVDENFALVKIKVFGRIVNKISSVSDDSLIENLQALTSKGISKEELIKRVLLTVRDSFPSKSKTRKDLAKITDKWVKRNMK